MIAGSTGTGKTLTTQVLAESYSDAGVPVFLCDVCNEFSGLSKPGSSKTQQSFSDGEYILIPFPTRIIGEVGGLLSIKLSDFGPNLFSSIIGVKGSAVSTVRELFEIADKEFLSLDSISDFKRVLNKVTNNYSFYNSLFPSIRKGDCGMINTALSMPDISLSTVLVIFTIRKKYRNRSEVYLKIMAFVKFAFTISGTAAHLCSLRMVFH